MYWVLISVKNSSRRRFVKNMFWKISQNSQEHTCVGVFFKQLQACNFIIRKTLTRVFSLKFCEIFTNTFFTEHFRATASAVRCVCHQNYWKQIRTENFLSYLSLKYVSYF